MIKRAVKVGRCRSEVAKNLFRVPITLTSEMEAWLTGLAREMKQTGGYKLPKTYIVRALIGAFMELKVNVAGVRSEAELVVRLRQAMRR